MKRLVHAISLQIRFAILPPNFASPAVMYLNVHSLGSARFRRLARVSLRNHQVEWGLTMTQISSSNEKLSEDSKKRLESTLSSNLEMTPEERIEAHENARQLMLNLQTAGKALH